VVTLSFREEIAIAQVLKVLINHFNARLASFGLSGLIRYMQSSYIQYYLYRYNSVSGHEWRPTLYAIINMHADSVTDGYLDLDGGAPSRNH